MVEVGGRSGAGGGRGRLRLRALKGLVSLIYHALLPLDEVRRNLLHSASYARQVHYVGEPALICVGSAMPPSSSQGWDYRSSQQHSMAQDEPNMARHGLHDVSRTGIPKTVSLVRLKFEF